jgi:hypothetical protein
MIRTRLAVLVSFLAVPLGVSAVACGGGPSSSADANAKAPAAPSITALSHEDCSESSNKVETLDTNGDGKPDIRRVFNKAGREICRISDLNHDGKPDLYEYYDDGGNVRRREYCYDDTGAVNAIETYDGGKLTKREYDTTGLHKVDTWDYFDGSSPVDAKTGRPTHPSRRERDVTGDGKPDQWWTWSGDNVNIAVDSNGDGKPDPASALTLGKDGQPIDTSSTSSAPSPAAPPAASSSAPSASSAAPAAAPSASAAPPAPASSVDGGTK